MASHIYERPGGAAATSFEEITEIVPFFDEAQPIIQMGNSMQNGNASQGTFLIVDPTSNADLSLFLPPHALIRWTIDVGDCELWLAQGRLSSSDVGRTAELVGGDYVEWANTTDDCNVDVAGLAFTEDWVRPAETDTARMYALQAYTFDGTSSTRPNSGGDITYRPSTKITCADDHLAPDTHTILMPAKTYPAGSQPADVIQDCSTTAGKIWGVVIHHGLPELTPIHTWDWVGHAAPPNGDPDYDNETGVKALNLLVEDSATYCPYGDPYCGYNTASHRASDEFSVTAGNQYGFSTNVRWHYNPAVRDIWIEWYDSGHSHMAGQDTIVADGSHYLVNTSYTISTTFTAPAGAFYAKIWFSPFAGIDVCQTVWSSSSGCPESHLCLEYIQETDHSTYASPIKISDEVTDWNPDDAATPVFEPHWDQGPGKHLTYQTAISGLVSRYGTGNSFITSLDTSIGDFYEYWNESYSDSDSVNSIQAANRAAALVSARKLVEQSDSVSVVLHDYQTPLITAGMSLQIKSVVIEGGVNLGIYQDRRVVELKWEPRADGMYIAHMVLSRGRRNLPPSRGRAQLAATSPNLPPAGTAVPGYSASGSVGTSQHYLPIDSVLAYPPTVAKTLTNKSGAGVVAGDVVVPDPATDDAFTTTNSADVSGSVWIAQATIANNAAGVVAVSGYVALANTTASVTRGHFGGTSTTIKKAHDQGATPTTGSFMQFLSSSATPDAVLGNFGGGGSGTGVATDTIWDTKGDLAVGTGADTASKLAVGANDTILMAESGEATGLKWVASDTPVAVSTANAIGTADTFTRGDHVHAHETGHVVHDTIWDAKGDLAVATGSDAAAKLTVGANGKMIIADSSQSSGLLWTEHFGEVGFTFGGAGTLLVTGEVLGLKRVAPYKCTPVEWHLMGDVSGSLVVDLWADTQANFPPANGDSIVASDKPTLSSQRYASGSCTGWSTINKGDIISPEIESVTTISQATLVVIVKQTT